VNPPTLLREAWLLDPGTARGEAGALLIDGERIAARFRVGEPLPADAEAVSLGGACLAPGFIDLHHHGRLPFDAPAAIADGLRHTSAQLARHGVTAFLPTTLSWTAGALRQRVSALGEALSAGGWPGAVPIGIHLEGPWIEPRAAGAQPAVGIRPYDPAEGADLLERAHGLVRMVTFAPEVTGVSQLQAELGRRSIVMALGHTLAAERALRASIDAGVRHATHLFNAMGPLHQRGPGVAASVLAEPRLGCDVIADGAHVHPDWVRVAARVKQRSLLLISDAIEPPCGVAGAPAEGLPPRGDPEGLGSMRAVDGAWRLPDGRLAGSELTLDRAIRNVVAWGALDRAGALAASSTAPARLLGLERERGGLRPGSRADLVALSEQGEVLRTWVGGRLVYSG
jgi:N-acetylglucosamine-6-phosphate deacetylase